MTRLVVAAGGGGDAVAAAMFDAAVHGTGERAVILTYAWDRLLVDAVPGPRGADGFTGLRSLTPAVRSVPARARPLAPAGSTLPRLAAELPHTFALLDPYRGVEGVTRQLEELLKELSPDSVHLLDVGGDILARGDEPTLKSPLADALTLAACCQVSAPVRLLVAGPGLDGELPAEEVCGALGAVVHVFTAEDVEAVGRVLDWHPSEAMAMLAATARGVRGACEVRGAQSPVALTDESPTVREADPEQALDRNELARAAMGTGSLAEVEELSRDICGHSELDHEREEAARFRRRRAAAPDPAALTSDPAAIGPDPAAMLSRLDRLEAEARGRGATHLTLGRITEALDLDSTQWDALRRLLKSRRADRYEAPLWRIPGGV
ncbi:DUF1152 domain-containing protein [Streptomyces cavernae]|uniref:DUF1152 domain-containing protein n=1 Tax=Streptomyces cavernae TaxID=2259034 RepID=UPI000FEB8746|nr:DUF1152 domain-containing protein [Streptomyces cavernae]